MTVNGKKVEVPVKQIVSGHRVKPNASLANPHSLEFYYKFVNVEELDRPLGKL
jgi:acetoacetyl-CoA synthetase